MRYILSLLLIFCGLAWADTVQQRVDALANASGVLGVSSEAEPTAVFAGLGKLRVVYATQDGNTAQMNTADLLVVAFGTGSEAAYWLGKVPAPLVDNTVVYFADRTASTITAAQIQTYCNQQWKAQTNHTNAGDIRNFSVAPVDGKTVQVSGTMNVIDGGSTWEHRSYLVRLLDPNGALSGANIMFERVTTK